MAGGTTKELRSCTVEQRLRYVALEVLANSAGLPQNMIIIAAKIPGSLAIPVYTVVDLPTDWNMPMPSSTRS